ncbi:SAM-dependent methyltransferase [Sinanaerobacter sp. ZZT-01]|uniref:class I SAM-dependent methyltransferase n=1 Tax=Sinanaerobacter sp. ZZT-01 TaxID=3111540 RepID=UPI002D785B40|nr:SAM-dependent methyltransferase [Sinanaerobacter sp. ZZT-01]WRR92258.1 SAM-dependent methyltransferase [Sinanaerobacter sp. ZZT-01]
MQNFISLLKQSISQETLIYISFGNVRNKSTLYRKVTIRPVLLRNQLSYQATYHFEKKVTHKNFKQEDCISFCIELLKDSFKQCNLFCEDADYQILAAKVDKLKIIKSSPSKRKEDIQLSHNQEKQYIIPDGEPCDFLIHLGVMTKEGRVIQRHYNKFRQINRFLEIVSDVIDYLPDRAKIIDFGCGKAYLTFALYYYLNFKLKKDVTIIGLDLKEDIIDFCNKIASQLHYDRLVFQMGDIAEYQETAKADMVVTLHACDTATDFALIKAVCWEASVILSVPCCQHELFSQIHNDINFPILKQGILKERFSAILTDSLRALKLTEHGYDVSMIEFTSLEHTAKNIMIRAVSDVNRKNQQTAAMKQAAEEFKTLCSFWNVNPTISKLC